MKIGVTGATGQLGRMIVEKLKERVSADSIVALVRNLQKAADLGVDARELDYTKPETMAASLKSIDTLLLISSSEIGKRAEQHINVIDEAKKADIKWIVYTSLLRADSSTISLAGEHFATEEAIKASGIPYTILRHGWYTENYTGSMKDTVAAGVLIGSVGNGKISSATRVDFAEADAVVLTTNGHVGKVYELAGDEAYTLADLAAEISRQTGENILYKNLPETDYANTLKSFGIPEGLAAAIASWDVSASKGDLFDDKHVLSKLIGRSTTPLAKVVADALR